MDNKNSFIELGEHNPFILYLSFKHPHNQLQGSEWADSVYYSCEYKIAFNIKRVRDIFQSSSPFSALLANLRCLSIVILNLPPCHAREKMIDVLDLPSNSKIIIIFLLPSFVPCRGRIRNMSVHALANLKIFGTNKTSCTENSIYMARIPIFYWS